LNTINEVTEVAEQTASLAGTGQNGLARMEATMRQGMEAACPRVRCGRYGDSASGRPNCCSQLRHRTAGKGDAVGGFGRCNEYGQVLRRSAPRGARSRTGERTIGANHPPSPGINASVRNRKRRDAITVYRCTTDQRSAGPV